MDSLIITLFTVGTIWMIAVIVPGPNLFILIQQGLENGTKSSIFIILGIAFGTFIWGVAGVLGITILFKTAPWLYLIFKILGGIYLLYLGIKLILSSYKRNHITEKSIIKTTKTKAFLLGTFTSISNPKTAMFVVSLFAVTMPNTPSFEIAISSIIVMVVISLFWYGFIAYLVTLKSFSRYYKKLKKYINILAGSIFIGFGTNIIFNK